MADIQLTVTGRSISVADYDSPSAGDVNACSVGITMSGIIADQPKQRVTFYNRHGRYTLDFADEMQVPQELLRGTEGVYITVTGYDADNSVVARTHKMAVPLKVMRGGVDLGDEPSAPVVDVLTRLEGDVSAVAEKADAAQAKADELEKVVNNAEKQIDNIGNDVDDLKNVANDKHINALIDAKLGVVENGAY